MNIRALAFLVVLSGCAASSEARDAGGFECPSAPPTSGGACDLGAICVYDRCASDGVVRAQCIASDAGSGVWSVRTEPCPDCQGTTCAPGQICIARVGGALIEGCATHSCGTGPLRCDCACGEGTECEITSTNVYDAVLACRVDCGADVCP